MDIRDTAFTDALSETLHVEGGRLRPIPVRFGLIQETRGLVVSAPSGAGKSTLIRRNLLRLLAPPGPKGFPEGLVAVTVKGEANLKSLGRDLRAFTGYSKIRPTAKTSDLFDVVRHRFEFCGVGLLWIDEAHHLFVPRRGGDPVKDVMRVLKSFLQQDHPVAVVLSGLPMLDEVLRTDDEASRRFGRLWLEPVAGTEDRTVIARAIEAHCGWAGLRPVEDPFLVDRLLFATGAKFGTSLETTVAAIRLVLLEGRTALKLEDFARALDRKAKPADLNPFLVRDWETLARVHPGAGGAK